MRFWDSSALLPLVFEEPTRIEMLDLLDQDDRMVLWWGTSVECHSALNRRFREGHLPIDELQIARDSLRMILQAAEEVQPTETLRILAHRLVGVYPIRAADALQLAASLVWSENQPSGRELVCLDQRLRQVGQQEGFTMLPATTGR
ncbi:MAG: type II toxin-antitoxin system VapC family toxin [Armatimonadetes bacterium]|nr:type II toxin-antitoxin system VapC family toxin [Armatimonadota bacterium]